MIPPMVLAMHLMVQPIANRDIPWFMAHPAERKFWISACQNDARKDPRICRNAHAAELRIYSMSGPGVHLLPGWK